MASPATPCVHADPNSAIAVIDSVGNEIEIDLEWQARTSSLIPKTTAVAKTKTKMILYTDSENQINPSSDKPTTIEGRSLRPAFLLIASLIECRSDMREPLTPRGVLPPCA